MADYPNINNVKLDSCCIKSIKEINKILKAAKTLSIGTGVGFFANMFGPSPSKMNTIVAVQQADFYTFAQAINAIPNITKKVVYDISSHEALKHTIDNNVKLEKFWKGMMDASH